MTNILFFLSHQPNPRFIKQINCLAESNKVNLIYFKRANLPDLNSNIANSVSFISAGEIESSGGYLSRLHVYFKSLRVLWRFRRAVHSDVVIVNNIDILLLEKFLQLLLWRSSKIVLEVSDLLQYALSSGAAAQLFRLFDQTIVRIFVDRLIVTSKRYYDVYYENFFRGPWLMLENKPLKKNLPPRIGSAKKTDKLVIGVVGLIYQSVPVKALFEAVKDDPNVEVQIYGRLYDAQNSKALIESYSAQHGNIIFKGEYDFFKDAGRIYGGLDLLYVSYDTAETMLNNRVALPNKLYEAMYFQVPIVASRGTYLAERVINLGIGYEVDCGNVQQIKYVLESHSARMVDFGQAFQSLKDDNYFADNDYQIFSAFVTAGLSPSARS